jgi:hypothetical protein
MEEDIDGKQRFGNNVLKLSESTSVAEIYSERYLNEEEQGLIQAFEFTHELAWNVMKDYFEYQEILLSTGSRETREASLIDSGWGTMDGNDKSRTNLHTYNESTAHDIRDRIKLLLRFVCVF